MTTAEKPLDVLVAIPGASVARACPNGCGTPVHLVARPSGVSMLVEVVGPGTAAPSVSDAGEPIAGAGIPHAPRCPKFRAVGRRAR